MLKHLLQLLTTAALLTIAAAFKPANYGGTRVLRQRAPIRMRDVWSEFVLLRPPADECEVEQAFNGTAFEFHANHVAGTTCDTERVPGTLRTIVLSSVLCTLVAVPALMANPSVVEKILEWAAVSVVAAAR